MAQGAPRPKRPDSFKVSLCDGPHRMLSSAWSRIGDEEIAPVFAGSTVTVGEWHEDALQTLVTSGRPLQMTES